MHGQRLGRHRSASSAGTGTIATKLGLCLCAGTLIAGPLLASAAEAAPVAVAAKSSPYITPTVQESTNVSRAMAGSRVRVTARVINPRTGKGVKGGTVRLQYRTHGAWRLYAKGQTDANGAVTFVTHPGSTLTYRSAYSGGSSIKAGVSRTNTVRIIRPASSGRGATVLSEAKRHVGALYLFAAAGPSRFDCSGYTMYVYRKAAGVKLPHLADQQQRFGKAVSKSSAAAGDLIVFRSGSYGYHTAIYAGGGYMYDSPHSGARVGKHKIYSGNYVVRRLV